MAKSQQARWAAMKGGAPVKAVVKAAPKAKAVKAAKVTEDEDAPF